MSADEGAGVERARRQTNATQAMRANGEPNTKDEPNKEIGNQPYPPRAQDPGCGGTRTRRMSSTAHSTLTLMLGRWRQCGSHVPGARHPVPLPILHGPSAATHSATRRSASAYGPPSVFRRDPYL